MFHPIQFFPELERRLRENASPDRMLTASVRLHHHGRAANSFGPVEGDLNFCAKFRAEADDINLAKCRLPRRASYLTTIALLVAPSETLPRNLLLLADSAVPAMPVVLLKKSLWERRRGPPAEFTPKVQPANSLSDTLTAQPALALAPPFTLPVRAEKLEWLIETNAVCEARMPSVPPLYRQ